MQRDFEAKGRVIEVNSVDHYRDKVERAHPNWRPPVHSSAREVVPDAPPTKTMSDTFKPQPR